MATKKIIEVDVVNSLSDSDAIFVNSNNSLKQISKSNLVISSEDGGYYTPEVDANGNLNWTASKTDMPAVDGANIKGPQGVSGVYVGSGDMPEGYNVQIDPDGTPSDIIPHIGVNGNWYIGDTDTGKPSRGEIGPAGQKGEAGENGKDGHTPVKGTDYFTESDKIELVNAVLAALPNAEGVAF